MRYIQSFSDSSAVQDALNNGELGKAYVVFDGTKIDFNSLTAVEPFDKQPLTFEIVSAGTLCWLVESPLATKNIIQYSLNDGDWTTWEADANPFNGKSVVQGDIIKIKGTVFSTPNEPNWFGGTAKFKAYGNLLSLFETNYQTVTSTTQAGCNIFSGCTGLVDAENLIIPYGFAFDHAFDGCTNITKSPQITARAGFLCEGMFSGCSSLNYVKCLFENIPYDSAMGTIGTLNWLNGTAASGTFVKSSNMNSWPTGVAGIPTGWTVIDA